VRLFLIVFTAINHAIKFNSILLVTIIKDNVFVSCCSYYFSTTRLRNKLVFTLKFIQT